MTKLHDPEALLSAYLEDGMRVLPVRVVDAVLDEIHRTRRQAVFGPWRTRSRSLLVAAALLVALVLASVAAVGALRLLQRDTVQDLNLERPTDIPAFVLSSHDRMPQLLPVAITTLKSDATVDRIYVDRSGAVRIEGYASADATGPVRTTVISGTSVGGTQPVGMKTVWLVDDEAISDDPRVFILPLTGLGFSGGPGCETSADPSETGSATAAADWRYVGADSVAGRAAHHLTCNGGDLWIDDATGLVLRVRQPDLDDAGNPIPGGLVHTTEVTKIEFGEQPPALFALTPPNGVEAMSSEAYQALCPGDSAAFQERPCSGTPQATPTPEPEPGPTPTVRPSAGDCAIPPPDGSTATGPLAWTQASPTEDWPAPIRPEPAVGATAEPMPPTYIDPAGDTGSDVLPCIDIRDLTVGDYDVALQLVSDRPPDVDPSKAWIATAWSSTTIATASRIGATGSTTCLARRGTKRATTVSGARISTPVEPSGRCDIGLGQGGQDLPRHRLPGRSLGWRRRRQALPRARCEVLLWQRVGYDRGHEDPGRQGGLPLLRLGLGHRRWSRRGHGLRP